MSDIDTAVVVDSLKVLDPECRLEKRTLPAAFDQTGIKHLMLAQLRAGLRQLSLQRSHFFFVFGFDLGNSCIELCK